ncbi:MAG: FAD-dependent oxidoreductase [Pyrinomonadaceae bacterium]
MNYDVAIAGGGIVGAACAYRLAAEGLSVALVEKDFPASGVTSRGMGHIVAMDDSLPQLQLASLSVDLWSRLSTDLPDNCEYENRGTLWIACDDEDLGNAEARRDGYERNGVSSRLLTPDELYSLEPNLRSGLAGALLVPNDSVVYQPAATEWFVKNAKGIAYYNEEITGHENGSLKTSSGMTISCGLIVNALGISAGLLSPNLRFVAKKGHLAVTNRYPGFVSHQLIELGYLKSAHGDSPESIAFNVQPRNTGQIVIGSSRQVGIDDTSIDESLLASMLECAIGYLPGLKDLEILRIWTGTRPSTPDNLPYIGKMSPDDDVIVAAGHEGLGITTATGTAELVADIVLERESRIDRNPFSPARISNSIASKNQV